MTSSLADPEPEPDGLCSFDQPHPAPPPTQPSPTTPSFKNPINQTTTFLNETTQQSTSPLISHQSHERGIDRYGHPIPPLHADINRHFERVICFLHYRSHFYPEHTALSDKWELKHASKSVLKRMDNYIQGHLEYGLQQKRVSQVVMALFKNGEFHDNSAVRVAYADISDDQIKAQDPAVAHRLPRCPVKLPAGAVFNAVAIAKAHRLAEEDQMLEEEAEEANGLLETQDENEALAKGHGRLARREKIADKADQHYANFIRRTLLKENDDAIQSVNLNPQTRYQLRERVTKSQIAEVIDLTSSPTSHAKLEVQLNGPVARARGGPRIKARSSKHRGEIPDMVADIPFK